MEFNGFKVVGTAVIVAGLMTSAFLAGGIATGGKSSADPEPTATAAAVTKDNTDEDVVLVGDKQDGSEAADEATEAPAQEPSQPQQPAPPAPAPVQPTPVPPVQPTPVPAPPTPVNEAPYVVSISPADGVNGVEPDSDIVVAFSESMDKATAQAALNLSTGNCGAFSWNGDATVMTFNPCADWDYGTEVQVEIYDSAADKLGLGMDDEFNSEFMVLRQSTIKLWSQDPYDGFVYAPGAQVNGGHVRVDGHLLLVSTWSRSFLSFRLSDLPEDLVEIQSASVSIRQKAHQPLAYTNSTGPMLIESVAYNTLSANDWGMSANVVCAWCIIPILSSDAADNWKSTSVTGYVRGDWEHRDERDYRSQFRLRFSKDCNGNCASISTLFYSGEGDGVLRPYLNITYTHP